MHASGRAASEGLPEVDLVHADLREHALGDGQLDAWDQRLVAAAAPIHRARRSYAVRVSARLGEIDRDEISDHGAVLRDQP